MRVARPASRPFCYAAAFGIPVPISCFDLAQVAFFAALIFTFYSAVIPPHKAVQLVPWDKASISSRSTP